uniref:ArnT family glycosyltransferase n=1 Tax=Eubacterium cellulosolvens TaxID=29322 RepID=UPI000486BFC2|nr:hypothetical protein [[Eubacterium] cellulosolvens]
MNRKETAGRSLPVFAVICVVVLLLTGLYIHCASMQTVKLDLRSAREKNLIAGENGEYTIADGAYVTKKGGPATLTFDNVNRYVGTMRFDFGEITTHELINVLTLTVFYDTGHGFKKYQKVEASINPGEHQLALHPLAKVRALKIQIGVLDKENFVINGIVLNPETSGWQPFFWLSLAAGIFVICFLEMRKRGRNRLFFLIASGLIVFFFGYAHLMFRRVDNSLYLLAAEVLILTLTVLVYAVEMDAKKRDKLILWTMMATAFAVFTYWAMILDWGKAPDEHMRMKIVEYVRIHGSIPRGDDPEIRDSYWGFGYSFYPVTTQVIAAWICRFVALFSEEGYVMLKAARMASVFCGTGTVYWAYRIGREAMPDTDAAYLLPVLTFTLPQLAFLNSYLNNDSLAIMSIMMILYFWIHGLGNGFSVRTSIGLAVGIGLCALSYYNAYGAILLSIPVFYYGLIRHGRGKKYMVMATALVILIACLIAGWWFIRSAILYNGDFLGRSTLHKTQDLYASSEALEKADETMEKLGVNIFGMLLIKQLHYVRDVGMSFVGRFGYMENTLRLSQYALIQLIIFIGSMAAFLPGVCRAVRYIRRKEKKKTDIVIRDQIFFGTMLFLLMVIPFSLALYYTWSSDFQKQGRYYMPVCVPLFYITARGMDNLLKKRKCEKNGAGYLLSLLLLLNLVMVFLSVAYQFYY